jgi:CRISPR-associated protein Cas2
MFVIAYDIEDDARRLRVARLLEGVGTRVQKSVFECDIDDRQFARLARRLALLLVPGDALRAYRLVREDSNVVVLGGVPRTKLPIVIIH